MPKTMSTLLMSNNKLTKLPKEIINFVPKLKYFNVENNQFNNLPSALAKIVAKGPTISFKGAFNIDSSNQNCIINYVLTLNQLICV